MIRGAKAAASAPAAQNAAEALLAGGAGAVDAVIAGFFGAAGADPGVLLAPAIALVGGFGAGGRAFDGRAAQPGRGAQRPRGFVDEASIPPGARLAAPRTIAMLALLHGYRGRAAFRELARPGVIAAEAAGEKARAGMLRKVGDSGVLALRAQDVERALLAAGGPVAGGALTAADLAEAEPTVIDAAVVSTGEGPAAYASPFEPADARAEAAVIVACDSRGGLAALAYAPAREGIEIPDLGLRMRRDAIPVRRGVTRVAPGTVLPMVAPIGIAVQAGGFAVAVGVAGTAPLDAAAVAGLLTGASLDAALGELRARLFGRVAVAVVTDGKTARGAEA